MVGAERLGAIMAGPLDGVKVVDFSQVVSGPFCAMLLADQGADVIKVEPLAGPGDLIRGIVSYSKGGFPALYINNNRGKRCLGVDLTSDEGRQIALDLCKDADIVLQNFRPGAMTRLGLHYDAVVSVNPDVIYCSISGFGETGPYADRPSLDPVIQGLTGIISRQINPDIPFPDLVRNLIADKSTSLTAAQAISAALFARERGAGGQHIQIPMLDAAMYFFWNDGMMDQTVIDDDASDGFRVATAYRLTDCSDGKIVYFVANDAQRMSLFDALGRPEWGADARFVSMASLSEGDNYAAMGALVANRFLELTVGEALEALIEQQVPSGPILSAEEAIVDPQAVHNGTIQTFQHPAAGTIQAAKPAAHFSKTEVEMAKWFTARGENNAEILKSIGRTDEEIAALESQGFIGT